MHPNVDVAIIGGGPAGCAAALTLRTRGYSTAVVSAPHDRERLTETAVPALRGLLHSLGAGQALSACEPCYGIVSTWGKAEPTLKPSILDASGHAWFVHRARFDLHLQQSVRDAGAAWIMETARTVEITSKGVIVRTNGELIESRWAIFAAGSPFHTARFTKQKVLVIDSLVAFWAYFSSAYEPRLLSIEPAEYGWWYLCPADGHGATACLVTNSTLARALKVARPEAWNNLFCQTKIFHELKNGSRASKVSVAPIATAEVPCKHGPGWIAAGDAAVKLDPIGSSGVTMALTSGKLAAQAAINALEGNSATCQHYASWSTGLIKEFAHQRTRHYAIEARRQTGSFWSNRFPKQLDPSQNGNPPKHKLHH